MARKNKVVETESANVIKFVPRNEKQRQIMDAIKTHDVTFIYGPAGAGKTHVPVVYAMQQLLKGSTKKIVFTRPCVEAYGENLGFLPGDFNDKIAPYMIAIFDILTRLMDRKTVQALIDEGAIQTIPLAFQRGITFNDTIVVADEFQNTIPQQVRMFLTRMGENCKMIVTGDISQNDIHGRNGLEDAIERFADIPEIALVETFHVDIVRNPLIEKIDKKYNEVLPSEREGKA